MLRKQLLFRLGAPVFMIVIGAIAAIVLLQGVLRDLHTASADASSVASAIDVFAESVTDRAASLGVSGADLSGSTEEIQTAFGALTIHECIDSDVAARLQLERVGAMIDQPGPGLESEIAGLRRVTSAHAAENQVVITGRLRRLIIGITVVWLVILNITLLTMLRTGAMILRPVEALVEGSRELAKERFGHRVDLSSGGEFGQLAEAYNLLAEQLELNDQRRMETLRQLGVSLNHELNNVISTIELQLGYLDRRTAGDRAMAERLTQIHDNLRRMASTVASLKDFKRIVVTEYVRGTSMLDLPRCTETVGQEADESKDVEQGHGPVGAGR